MASTTKPSIAEPKQGILDSIDYSIMTGTFFGANEYDTDVDIADNKSWIIRVPVGNVCALFSFLLTSSQAGTAYIYENPTITSMGTEITPFNFNRVIGSASVAKLYKDPTITNTGTLLISAHITSTTLVENLLRKIVAAPNCNYMIRFIPDADNAKVNAYFEWTEVNKKYYDVNRY